MKDYETENYLICIVVIFSLLKVNDANPLVDISIVSEKKKSFAFK